MVDRRALFVCVYKHRIPTRGEWASTERAAANDQYLQRFLDSYWTTDSYFDWGDDPGFFCASVLLGDARRATWSVCRPDVRKSVVVGDGVAFFVCRPIVAKHGEYWRSAGPEDYFYIGCGTVGAKLINRQELWRLPEYAPYREFYNILVRTGANGALYQSEVFHSYHDDWRERSAAPVIFFDAAKSWFNLKGPHHVARFDTSRGIPEVWLRDAISQRLERLLFGDGCARRLRTSRTGYQHAKRVIRGTTLTIDTLIAELVEIAAGRLP
jgi:hypothetical protein